MKIKLFTFQKNELDILDDWILYHSYLFGEDNIHIIDHDSDDECLEILEKYNTNYKTYTGNFYRKHRELTKEMVKYKKEADILIPLDLDEFICFDDSRNDIPEIDTNREKIIDEIANLPDNHKYKFTYFHVLDHSREYNDPLIEMNKFWKEKVPNMNGKTFYPAKIFKNTDQGNHRGALVGKYNKNIHFSKLGIMHFHVRGFHHFKSKMVNGKKAYGDSVIGGTHWKTLGKMIEESDIQAEIAYQQTIDKYNRPYFTSSIFEDRLKLLRSLA
jgi:hypothetical protein